MQRFHYFIAGILVVMALDSHAQSVVPSNIRATNTIDKLSDMRGLETGEMLFGIPLPEGKVIGDTYLDVQWKTGSVMLYDKDKLIEHYPVRYDIHAHELDIKTGKGVKVIAGNKIKSFSWADSSLRAPVYFINAKDFRNEEGGVYSGFFEVLVDGTLPLVRKTNLLIKKADYNVQLNVGSPDDKIIKKDIYYYVKEGKALEVPSSKKKLLALFGQHADAVEHYMKENKSASKQHDLVLAFDYYKKLVKT